MIPTQTFPWRPNNSFELLIDSERFFPEMLHAIDQAKYFVFVEQYLIKSGRVLDMFITSLTMAAQRGVKIYILLDDYGSKGVTAADLKKLNTKNIFISHYNPFRWSHLYKSMRRNHRKLIVVDHRLAFVGGACISDEYRFKQPNTMSWHDIVLKMSGAVVHDWHLSFANIWNSISNEELPEVKLVFEKRQQQQGRVALAQGPGRNQVIRSAIQRIKKSRHRVWIATPYFLTTHKLRRVLKKAANHQVDVRLLLPGPISDHPWISQAARRYYSRLIKNGVKIFEYQPRFIHAKLILCDDWLSVGSSNLDRWNQFWNLDANQIVRDPDLTEETVTLFEKDFAASKLITLESWKNRSTLQRFLEWWSIYIVRVIQWLVFFATRISNTSRNGTPD